MLVLQKTLSAALAAPSDQTQKQLLLARKWSCADYSEMSEVSTQGSMQRQSFCQALTLTRQISRSKASKNAKKEKQRILKQNQIIDYIVKFVSIYSSQCDGNLKVISFMKRQFPGFSKLFKSIKKTRGEQMCSSVEDMAVQLKDYLQQVAQHVPVPCFVVAFSLLGRLMTNNFFIITNMAIEVMMVCLILATKQLCDQVISNSDMAFLIQTPLCDFNDLELLLLKALDYRTYTSQAEYDKTIGPINKEISESIKREAAERAKQLNHGKNQSTDKKSHFARKQKISSLQTFYQGGQLITEMPQVNSLATQSTSNFPGEAAQSQLDDFNFEILDNEF